MNIFDQSDIQILLKKPIRISNLLQIYKYILSQTNIEHQKKIIKLICASVPINKIRESNIFGTSINSFIEGIKSRQLRPFIFNFNRDNNLIPCSEIKEISYKGNGYKGGYVYINPNTLNLYTDADSFVIKYDSINLSTISGNLIELNLNTSSKFALEIKTPSLHFEDKLIKKLKGKIEVIDSASSQDKGDLTANLVNEDPSLCKLIVSSPEKTKMINKENLNAFSSQQNESDIANNGTRSNIITKELSKDETSSLQVNGSTFISSPKQKENTCFLSTDFPALLEKDQEMQFRMKKRTRLPSKEKRKEIDKIKPKSEISITKLDKNVSESDVRITKEINQKFTVEPSNDSLSTSKHKPESIEKLTKSSDKCKSLSNHLPSLNAIPNKERSRLMETAVKLKRNLDSLNQTNNVSRIEKNRVNPVLNILNDRKKKQNLATINNINIVKDQEDIEESQCSKNLLKKSDSKSYGFFKYSQSTDYDQPSSEIDEESNSRIVSHKKCTDNIPNSTLIKDVKNRTSPLRKDNLVNKRCETKNTASNENLKISHEKLDIEPRTGQVGRKSSILRSELTFHNIAETHRISENLGIGIATSYLPRKIFSSSNITSKSCSNESYNLLVANPKLPKMYKVRKRKFTKLMRKRHKKLKRIFHRVFKDQLHKRKAQLSRLIRNINSFYVKYDDISKFINEMWTN